MLSRNQKASTAKPYIPPHKRRDFVRPIRDKERADDVVSHELLTKVNVDNERLETSNSTIDTKVRPYIPPHKREGFTKHARDRQRERGISTDAVKTTIRKGMSLWAAESTTYISHDYQVVKSRNGKIITVNTNPRNSKFNLFSKTTTKEKQLLSQVRRNNTAAMCELAELYLSDDIGEPQPLKAEELLLRAAGTGRGSSHAMCLLSQLYESDQLSKPNSEESQKWMQRAAEHNNKYALAVIGQRYYREYLRQIATDDLDPLACDDSLNQAIHWLTRGANKGSTRAMWHLARLYEVCLGERRNTVKALRLYKQAALMGSPNSLFTLQERYREEKLSAEEFEKILEKASALITETSSDLAVDIALHQIKGRLGEKVQRGINMLEALAERRVERALQKLGYLYKRGKYVEINREHSQYWYEKLKALYEDAAEDGNLIARVSLGECYEQGIGVDVNIEKAIKEYRLAADSGSLEALIYLGELYFNQNEPHMAAEYYGELLEINKSHVYASFYHNIACCFHVIGDTDRAEKLFVTAMNLPDQCGSALLAEYALFLSQQPDRERDVVAICKRALKLRRDDDKNVYTKTEKKCIGELLGKLVEDRGEVLVSSWEIVCWLAVKAHHQLGQLEDAHNFLKIWEKMLTPTPSIEALFLLFDVCQILTETAKADHYRQKIVDREPDNQLILGIERECSSNCVNLK